jgi:dihydrofolate reductase
MWKVVLQFWISVDGYSCDADSGLWQVMQDITDDEQESYLLSRLQHAGSHIMGRATYEEMASHWPTSDHPFAAPMNDIPKVVFSRTLQSAEWPVTRIARGDLAEEIGRLKAEPGGQIIAYGGYQFVRSLIQRDLVDEYRLWVVPGVAGQGAALFTGLAHPVRLRLVSSTPFPSGILELAYAPAAAGRT